jgi:hypothetical protein
MTLPDQRPGSTLSVKVSQVMPSVQPASPSSGSVVAPPVAVPVQEPVKGRTGPVVAIEPDAGLAARAGRSTEVGAKSARAATASAATAK